MCVVYGILCFREDLHFNCCWWFAGSDSRTRIWGACIVPYWQSSERCLIFYYIDLLWNSICSDLVCCCSSLVVSAGIVRIFGQEVAELPLVATLSGYQGKVRCTVTWPIPYFVQICRTIIHESGILSILKIQCLFFAGLLPVTLFLYWKSSCNFECEKPGASCCWWSRIFVEEQVRFWKDQRWRSMFSLLLCIHFTSIVGN